MSQAARTRRFHVEDLRRDRIALPAGEAHHALHVLRLAEGAEVELFDGRGGRAAARVVGAGRDEVAVRIVRRLPPAERPRPVIHLAFAVPKGKRLDWLIEKATELAVASLRPVLFERSVSGGALPAVRRDRWLAHCISAAKQSGLDFLPEIVAPEPLSEALCGGGEGVRLLGCAGEGSVPVVDALPARGGARVVWLLVGPEGGLTEGETAAVAEAGFRRVRLGPATLRVETAAVALVAATHALLGS